MKKNKHKLFALTTHLLLTFISLSLLLPHPFEKIEKFIIMFGLCCLGPVSGILSGNIILSVVAMFIFIGLFLISRKGSIICLYLSFTAWFSSGILAIIQAS